MKLNNIYKYCNEVTSFTVNKQLDTHNWLDILAIKMVWVCRHLDHIRAIPNQNKMAWVWRHWNGHLDAIPNPNLIGETESNECHQFLQYFKL